MERWAKIAIVSAAVVIGAVLVWLRMPTKEQPMTVSIKGRDFNAVILDEDRERKKGLSGTKSLPSDRAMVFVFSQEYKWRFWMKDMNYPIDMIWLDKAGKVVHLVNDAQPSTYNKEDPESSMYFIPDKPALYVIETVSGTIKETGLKMGDAVQLPSGI